MLLPFDVGPEPFALDPHKKDFARSGNNLQPEESTAPKSLSSLVAGPPLLVFRGWLLFHSMPGTNLSTP
jgi:hypothetical protein